MRKLFFGKEREERLRNVERQALRMERRVRSLLRMVLHERFSGTGLEAPGFDPFPGSLHSENNEDGITLRVFSEIGVLRHSFLEIGIQDGLECNAAILALAFGWHGVLMDGDPEWVRSAKANYAQCPGVAVRQAFVTRENINELVGAPDVDRDSDLFSLDIDGNEYWVWKALSDFRPRLAIIEFNQGFGFDRSVTIPYDPNFVHRAKTPRGYLGSSLPALLKLGREKGYVLVGVTVRNAFFVRESEMKGRLRELSLAEARNCLPPQPSAEKRARDFEGWPLEEV